MIAEQKVFDKLRLQESLIKNFQEVIHHIQDELVEKKSMADLEEGDTLDPEDYSKQNESNEMVHILKNQLQKTLLEIDKLARIDFSKKSQGGHWCIGKKLKNSCFLSVLQFPLLSLKEIKLLVFL